MLKPARKMKPSINRSQNILRRSRKSENGDKNQRSSIEPPLYIEPSRKDERSLRRRDSRNTVATKTEKRMPYVAESASRTTLNPARSIAFSPRKNVNPLSMSIMSVRLRMQIATTKALHVFIVRPIAASKQSEFIGKHAQQKEKGAGKIIFNPSDIFYCF